MEAHNLNLVIMIIVSFTANTSVKAVIIPKVKKFYRMYDNLERNTYNSYRLYIFVYERKRERVRASACMCVNI